MRVFSLRHGTRHLFQHGVPAARVQGRTLMKMHLGHYKKFAPPPPPLCSGGKFFDTLLFNVYRQSPIFFIFKALLDEGQVIMRRTINGVIAERSRASVFTGL